MTRLSHCRWCGTIREVATLAPFLVLVCPHCDYICARGAERGCTRCISIRDTRLD